MKVHFIVDPNSHGIQTTACGKQGTVDWKPSPGFPGEYDDDAICNRFEATVYPDDVTCKRCATAAENAKEAA